MDTTYLHSLRHRMQSRLEQVKVISVQLEEDKKNALKIIQQFGGYIGSPDEVNHFREEITALGVTSSEIINDLLDELEIIERYDWQYVADAQEKCTTIILAAYEEPLRLKSVLEQIFCRLMETVRKHLQSSNASPESTVEGHTANIESYSTPSLDAMNLAIQKFWLHNSENKVPTQKAVSNFIAEQLGKPIRDRFTDELARAIKPE